MQSPIQVQSGPIVAYLQRTDENWCVQHDMANKHLLHFEPGTRRANLQSMGI